MRIVRRHTLEVSNQLATHLSPSPAAQYCQKVFHQQWSVMKSAGTYSATAGLFAVVLIPLLLLLLDRKKQEEDAVLARHKVIALILGSCAYAFSASFLYGVIAGDNNCIRANVVDAPASILFGTAACLAFVALTWLIVMHSKDGSATSQQGCKEDETNTPKTEDTVEKGVNDLITQAQYLALLVIVIVSGEVDVTLMQVQLSAQANSNNFPGALWTIFDCLAVAISLVAAIAHWSRKSRAKKPDPKMATIKTINKATISYLAVTVIVGVVAFNMSFNKASRGHTFNFIALASALFYGVLQAMIVNFMPGRKK